MWTGYILRHWSRFFKSFATDDKDVTRVDMDWKLGQLFPVLHAISTSGITKTIYYLIIMVNVPGKICLRSSSYLQRSILCVDKVCKKWLQHRIDRNKQYPRDKDLFQYSCGFLHRGVRFLGLLRRKVVVDRKRSRRKGEREGIKSRENREFEQCVEVESSEKEPRKTDQAMDKIIKALTTDMKKTPKNVRNRSFCGGGSWKSHLRKPLLVAR